MPVRHTFNLNAVPELVDRPIMAAKPNTPFLLQHHPAGWDVASEGLDGPTWLPVLKKFVVRPGINGCRTLRANEPMRNTWAAGIVAAREDGWTVLEREATAPIPATMLPSGVAPGGYLRTIECKAPNTNERGARYVEVWDLPTGRPLPGGEQRFKFDRGAYNRWRLHLVESGVIAPPEPQVIEQKQKELSARVPRHRGANYSDPEQRKEAVAAATARAEDTIKAAVPGVGGAR